MTSSHHSSDWAHQHWLSVAVTDCLLQLLTVSYSYIHTVTPGLSCCFHILITDIHTSVLTNSSNKLFTCGLFMGIICYFVISADFYCSISCFLHCLHFSVFRHPRWSSENKSDDIYVCFVCSSLNMLNLLYQKRFGWSFSFSLKKKTFQKFSFLLKKIDLWCATHEICRFFQQTFLRPLEAIKHMKTKQKVLLKMFNFLLQTSSKVYLPAGIQVGSINQFFLKSWMCFFMLSD